MPYFSNFIGNQRVKELLTKSLENDKVNHAYIFSGPKSIGKKTMAKELIKALVCLKQDKQVPCNICLPCQQVKRQVHPDILWIKKGDDKKNITIEQVREAINQLNKTSFLGSFKAAVICEADNMSLSAANALLKTLEEPTPKTILILTTQRILNLPKTIVSRSQVIKFFPVPCQEILSWLKELNYPEADIQEANIYALGRPGLAKKILEEPENIRAFRARVGEFTKILESPLNKRFDYLDDLFSIKRSFESNRQLALNLLNIWCFVLRDLALIKCGFYDNIINVPEQKIIEKVAHKFDLKKLILLIKQLEATKTLVEANINQRLAFDNFILNI